MLAGLLEMRQESAEITMDWQVDTVKELHQAPPMETSFPWLMWSAAHTGPGQQHRGPWQCVWRLQPSSFPLKRLGPKWQRAELLCADT